MTHTPIEEIVKALDKKLEALFNDAVRLCFAQIRGEITEKERIFALKSLNEVSEEFIRESLTKMYERGIKDSAKIASDFSMKKTQIHPDILWDEMNDTAKSVMHTTAQQIAGAILKSTHI